MIEIDQIKILEKPELVDKLGQLKQELFHFRGKLAMGRMENPMRIREVKRDIARVHTVIREKS